MLNCSLPTNWSFTVDAALQWTELYIGLQINHLPTLLKPPVLLWLITFQNIMKTNGLQYRKQVSQKAQRQECGVSLWFWWCLIASYGCMQYGAGRNICLTLGEVVLALITCRFSYWDLKIDRSLSDSMYFQENALTNKDPHWVFS